MSSFGLSYLKSSDRAPRRAVIEAALAFLTFWLLCAGSLLSFLCLCVLMP